MTDGWPCQVCNVAGRTVANRGDACEHCQQSAAAWDDPGIPTPSVHEILPPRYQNSGDRDRNRSRKEPRNEDHQGHPDQPRADRPDVAPRDRRSPVVLGPRPLDDGDQFYDQVSDARAELAGEGVYLSQREAVAMSLNATHGNGDLYPHLRDRHPFGLPSPNVPKDGHLAPASLPGAMTPTGLRTAPPLAGAQADGSTDLPDLAA